MKNVIDWTQFLKQKTYSRIELSRANNQRYWGDGFIQFNPLVPREAEYNNEPTFDSKLIDLEGLFGDVMGDFIGANQVQLDNPDVDYTKEIARYKKRALKLLAKIKKQCQIEGKKELERLREVLKVGGYKVVKA